MSSAPMPTTLEDFTAWLAEHRGVEAADYAALHRWSVTEPGRFW